MSDFSVVFIQLLPLLLKGLVVTVQVTVLALIIAMGIGLVSCLFGMARFRLLQAISRFYLWLIRGTPLMVQVFFVYFSIPQLIQSLGYNVRLTALTAGVITLSLNAGAYLSEIFRGGIQAVPVGQMEAARSLGLTKGHAMYRVILPQAIRICIPSMVNQFIISLKDTSIISVISLTEIVYQAKIYMGRTMQSFYTWTSVAIVYLLIITLITWVSRYIERRLDKS